MERPLLKLPEPTNIAPRRPVGGGPPIARPSRGRQAERIDPRFDALSRVAGEPDAILALRADPASIAPERAIVFEVEGSVEDFFAQARDIGLQYLGDYEEDFAPTEDFFNQKEREKTLSGRVYLAMPSVRSLQEMLGLWNFYKQNRRMPNGKGEWRVLFSKLIDIRPWGPQDRVPEEAIKGFREELDRDPLALQRVEIELWFHDNTNLRDAVAARIAKMVNDLGGRIIDQAVIEGIRYHALLTEIPAVNVENFLAARDISIARSDEIMFLRPQSVAMHRRSGEQDGTESDVAPAAAVDNELPVVALLDGLPIQNHVRLANRLIVDDPDGLDEHYPVAQREHGTEMASLIVHGDLNLGEPPLTRPLYVRPVMQPTAFGERTSPDRLLVDVIYQAVRRIKEGNGEEPAVAPSVAVINLSLGDEKRPFARVMSPLGRLLDYLSYHYRVLFLVSAGNILDRLDVEGFRTSVEFEAATPEQREQAILTALNAKKNERTLFSPAESINALTIGAAHSGSAFDGNLPQDWHDPFTVETLPSIISAMGLGFRKVVKPELLFAGGRTPVRIVGAGDRITLAPIRTQARRYGLKAARPSNLGGDRYEDFASGTSVSTALATRAAHKIFDSLMDVDGGSNHGEIAPEFLPVVIKTLMVHGAAWCPKGEFLDQHFGPQGKGAHLQRRDDITRLLGFGYADTQRVLDCISNRATLLGYDSIRPGQGLLYKIPLPGTLDGRLAARTLTTTLAWMSPVNTRHQGYRMAALDISSGSDEKYWIAPSRSCQPTDKATMRGTVFHEYRADTLATVFSDDGQLLLRVSCRASAGEYNEAVPFAIAVSFEVGIDAGIDVYQELRVALQPPIPAAVVS